MPTLIEIMARTERCLDYFATYNTFNLRVLLGSQFGSVRISVKELATFKNTNTENKI
jgi:hypothetical protein